MIAGVPGAGISAIFYLLAVLAMPFVAIYRSARAGSLRAGRWRLVARQMAVAGGIAGGLVIGGIAVGLVVAALGSPPTPEQARHVVEQVGVTLSRLGLVLGLLTLSLVLVAVQLASVLVARRSRARTGPNESGYELEGVPAELRGRR